MFWSFTMVAGLIAGAQVTCIFLLPSMLVWTCFHYSAGGKQHALLNFALTVALAYFGFVPFPAMPLLEWTPAAIWMMILTILTVLAAVPALAGGKMSDAQYDGAPYLKQQFCDDEGLLSDVTDMDSGEKAKSYRRARELAFAGHLLGAGCCMAAAVVSGGAADLCLLVLIPFTTNGYCHWLRREEHAQEKFGAFFCWVLAAVTLGFGLAR